MTPSADRRAPSRPGMPGRGRVSMFPWQQRDLRTSILALALPAFVAFGALAFAITLSPQFRALDRSLTRAFREALIGNPAIIQLAKWATWLGSGVGIALVTAIAVVVLLAVQRWRGAIYVLATLIPGWLVGFGLKFVIDRARPTGALIPIPADASFPSGHSLASFLLYGSLAVLALTWVRRRWLAWTLAALACLVILAVGYSRVLLGVHFFADVLGSWLLGFAWLSTTSAVYLALVGPKRGNAEN